MKNLMRDFADRKEILKKPRERFDIAVLFVGMYFGFALAVLFLSK